MARTCIVLVLLVVSTACGESVPHPPYSPQATSALEPIEFAPPPGRIELIPRRPPQADAWVDGEWLQRHGRWDWLLGRWVKTPPGATYSPWVFVRSLDGHAFYAPGVWKDAEGAPITPPPPLSFATANTGAVFDPEGNLERTGRNVETGSPASGADGP